MIGTIIEFENALLILIFLLILGGALSTVLIVILVKFLKKKPFWFTKKQKIIYSLLTFSDLIILVVSGFFIHEMFFIAPGLVTTYPLANQGLLTYDQPIYAIFDRPISDNSIKPYIFPEIKGEWRVESVSEMFPQIKRKVVFYPEESMFEGKVFIYYDGIRNAIGLQDEWGYAVDSWGVILPSTAESSTDNVPVDFPVNSPITLKLDKEYNDQVDFEFSIEPKIAFKLEKTDNTSLNIKFEGTLSQSTEYSYKLYKVPQRYNIKTREVVEKGEMVLIKEGKFTTIHEPLIKSISPEGSNVLANTQIKIVFDQIMVPESVKSHFSINPSLSGNLVKVDDHTFVFNSTNMAKGTKYDIKLAKGIVSNVGGETEQDVNHSFTTIGRVTAGLSPGYNASNIKRSSTVRVAFNQAVDHASAESKFSISPSVAGSFSWEGNTLVFKNNSGFGYATTYTVNVASGVKSINGLDSSAAFSTRFSTETQTFVLNVPVYRQSVRFSCQFVATGMALAYKTGRSFDPMSLYNQVDKDGTQPTCDSNQNIVTWGNPYNGYVGNVYGNAIAGCNRSGYGVYWAPVNRVVNIYRSSRIISGASVQQLLGEVANGNPVIIWAHNGYSGSGSQFSWTTPGGASIRAVTGMHSYVVVGFIGSVENPTSIILNDPNRGRWTISTGYFNGLWSYFGNTGIVVY
jgi:uncharacterized protein YvpB